MKEIWKKKKIFVITIALMVGIIGTAATFAIITATAGTVTNTFQAAKVATEIEVQEMIRECIQDFFHLLR